MGPEVLLRPQAVMGWGGERLGNIRRESRGQSALKGRKGRGKGSWLSRWSLVVRGLHCQWPAHEPSSWWCRGQLSPVAVFIKGCRTGFDRLFIFLSQRAVSIFSSWSYFFWSLVSKRHQPEQLKMSAPESWASFIPLNGGVEIMTKIQKHFFAKTIHCKAA